MDNPITPSSPDPPKKRPRIFDDFQIIRAIRRISTPPNSQEKPSLTDSTTMSKKSSTPSTDPKTPAPQKELDEATLEAVSGGAGVNVTGTDQDDTLTGTSAADVLAGEAGDDDIQGGRGADTITGGDGDDFLHGNQGDDNIHGGKGQDTIRGGKGADTIDGGDGDDDIKGSYGEDNIRGGYGNDVIDGGGQDDWINAGSGDDIVKGGSGDDFIKGNAGHDTLDGGTGDDHITGEWGRDVISGGDGDDVLDGGYNRDTIDGGAGDDTIIIRPGDGQDTITGGEGRDILLLAKVTTAQVSDWNYRAPDGTVTALNELMVGQTIDLAGLGGAGELIAPDGAITTFTEMEILSLEIPSVSGAEIAPLQAIPPHVDGTPVATIIGGLPAGVYVAGTAEPPVAAGDGSYFQVVDRESLINGDLQLVFGGGIVKDLALTVATMTKGDGEVETTSGSFTVAVEPQDSDFFAVSHGEMGFETKDSFGKGTGWVPLDIVINPEIATGASIDISGLSSTMRLINADGEEFTPVKIDGDWIVAGLQPSQLSGLHIRGTSLYDLRGAKDGSDPDTDAVINAGLNFINNFVPETEGSYDISVNIEAEFEGESLNLSEQVTVEFPEVEVVNGTDSEGGRITTVLGIISGDRSEYDVVRNGNTISVIPEDGGEAQTFSMFDFDAVRFSDGIVMFDDFRQEHDISAVFNQLEANEQLTGTTVILVSGLPEGAILDLGAHLGGGVWGIPAQAVANGLINLDFPSVEASASASVSVNAAVLTEGEAEVFNGLLRVGGYASAELIAQSTANARFALDGNGLRASAGAKTEAAAVASAGGTFGQNEFQVEVSASWKAEAAVAVDFSATEARVEGYIGVRAEIKAEGEVTYETGVPGVSGEATGEVGVAMYAEAEGKGSLQFGDGDYGASGEGGAGYGYAATADGYHSQTVGGFTGGAGAGTSAGLQAGASGGGHAGIQDGKIHFGLSGDVALLVGVEFDFDIEIDTGKIADAANLVADGVVGVGYALHHGLMNATDAIEGGLIDAGTAFAAGFMNEAEEIAAGFRNAEKELTKLGKEAEKTWNDSTGAVEDAWNSIF